uniref:Uncharacterized protein n=1 Tax=Myotis myotis TaxID=51298 RepID=A0A7J7Z4A8_MYOMY|nr:hypothetical protein mMyoMyo1_010427 [Myotis myotis]
MPPAGEREVVGHCLSSQLPCPCPPPTRGLESKVIAILMMYLEYQTQAGSSLLGQCMWESVLIGRMSVILESAWQFVDLNATARKYCKLLNCIYRRFPSISGSPCVIYVCVCTISGFWKMSM